jgi:hypothetical protein
LSIVTFGGVVSAEPPPGPLATIVQSYETAVEALFAASVPRTRNVWAPTPSELYERPLVHVEYEPESSAHSNVAVSSAWNVKVADVAVVEAAGPPSIVTDGGVVSGTVTV